VLTNGGGTAIVICSPVYISAAATCNLAEANALATTRVAGLVQDTSIASGSPGNIQTNGILIATTTQWNAVTGQSSGLTAGAIYYLSPTVAGMLTTTPPATVGQFAAPVGLALSATSLLIQLMSIIQL
jgi:hypothetical protein